METNTTIHRDPVPTGVRRIALAFVLAAGLIAGSFAVVAGEDEKPANAGPVTAFCNWTYWDIPPLGGTLSTPNLRNTQGQVLDANAENRVWVAIRGLDNAVWITYYQNSTRQWSGVWYSLGGATISAPRLDSPGPPNGSQLYVRTIGTDGHVYGRSLTPVGWGSWYAVSVNTNTYYGTPAPQTAFVDLPGSINDVSMELRKNGQEPEYRCAINP